MLDPDYSDLLSAFRAHEVRFLVVGIGLQIGVAPVRVDVLTLLSGIRFEQAWRERVPARFGDQECFVISAADMLINKRAAGRPKDLADASALEDIIARTKPGE